MNEELALQPIQLVQLVLGDAPKVVLVLHPLPDHLSGHQHLEFQNLEGARLSHDVLKWKRPFVRPRRDKLL